MKKGETYEGIVERMDFPNKGIVTVDGERAIVKNALPGQKIRFVINKKRNGRSEGRLLEVLERSPLEVDEGRCKHFGICGGCVSQSIPYEEQLKIKEQQVKALMDEVVREKYEFEGIKASPAAEGYRNKMEFSFGDEYKDGPLALGMHRRGSFYDVVTVDECRIVNRDFTEILGATKEYFEGLGVGFYKKMQHTGYLRHLLVRRAVKTGEILVALVTSTQVDALAGTDLMAGAGERSGVEELAGMTTSTGGKELAGVTTSTVGEELAGVIVSTGGEELAGADALLRTDELRGVETKILEKWKKMLLALPLEGRFAGILHIQNDSLADVVKSDETEILYGQDFFYEELLGLRFKISPFSFFQTNSLGAEVLYETARGYVGDTKDKVVFDLYSGTGTIAQMIAPVAKKVVGVEIVEEAVEAAKVNAELNGLHNCEFIAGDVLKVIDDLTDKPDLIILDPPRDGIHGKALEKIIDFGVDRMVYISCKPTSLARDLVILQERGYRVEKVCAVDMFPSTGNVETVVELTFLS